MEAHVNTICKSAYFHLRNIGRIRKYLTKQAAETLIHAFITTRLDFMNGLLACLPNNLLKKLQRIQNTAARIVTRTKLAEHITPVLYHLHWLPVQERIKFKLLILTFRSLNGQAPKYMENMLLPYQPKRHLRSECLLLLEVPRTRTARYGDRAFSKAAPMLWNKLPLDIRQSKTLTTFKGKLKTHLFKQYFDSRM